MSAWAPFRSREPAETVTRLLREDGATVFVLSGAAMTSEGEALSELFRVLRQREVAPSFAGPAQVAGGWNSLSELLEEFQTGPERVALVVDDAHSADASAISTLSHIVGNAAQALARREAWGAPPSNFPDDTLVAVDLGLYLIERATT